MTEKIGLKTISIEKEGNAFESNPYSSPNDGLEYAYLERLKSYSLFNLAPLSTKGRKNNYKGDFLLNEETLNKLYLDTDIDTDKLREVITPKSNISYQEAMSLLNGDLEFLLTSMTLMSNSYISVLNETDSKLLNRLEIENIEPFKTPFLFTNAEEIMFFTGRTLLKDLNKDNNDEYLNGLIRDIDFVVFRFNAGLIKKQINKFTYPGNPDYFQAGTEGLLRAIELFDIKRKHKFSTYATRWVLQKMIIHHQENLSSIVLPRYMNDALRKLRLTTKKLRTENGHPPSLEEALAYCRANDDSFPNNDQNIIKALGMPKRVISLDNDLLSAYNGVVPRYELIVEPKSPYGNNHQVLEDIDFLRSLIEKAQLDPISIKVLKMRYGFINRQNDGEFTYKEIAEHIGITPSKVKRIEEQALQRIKAQLI
jgi:RNA polymerase sigma factor (sigma-70 family)